MSSFKLIWMSFGSESTLWRSTSCVTVLQTKRKRDNWVTNGFTHCGSGGSWAKPQSLLLHGSLGSCSWCQGNLWVALWAGKLCHLHLFPGLMGLATASMSCEECHSNTGFGVHYCAFQKCSPALSRRLNQLVEPIPPGIPSSLNSSVTSKFCCWQALSSSGARRPIWKTLGFSACVLWIYAWGNDKITLYALYIYYKILDKTLGGVWAVMYKLWRHKIATAFSAPMTSWSCGTHSAGMSSLSLHPQQPPHIWGTPHQVRIRHSWRFGPASIHQIFSPPGFWGDPAPFQEQKAHGELGQIRCDRVNKGSTHLKNLSSKGKPQIHRSDLSLYLWVWGFALGENQQDSTPMTCGVVSVWPAFVVFHLEHACMQSIWAWKYDSLLPP